MRVGDATTDSPFRSERVNSPGTQAQHCLGQPTTARGPEVEPLAPAASRVWSCGPTNHSHGAAMTWFSAGVSRRVQKDGQAWRHVLPDPGFHAAPPRSPTTATPGWISPFERSTIVPRTDYSDEHGAVEQ